MRTIKVTAKRQATLPAEMCQDLDLHPGDRLALERRRIDGEPAWIVRPVGKGKVASWFRALRSFASGKSHAMADIRRSIGLATGEAGS
ncbi:MAG: AbrB/MazE/SpoVT family DNA-binding domain-containing protein [Lentisphaeria bacterium]|nr:AbrB/MazE/SpoVT family DNA-binding domain-containing protein [Lentisphaeria bacterium]